MSLYDVFRPLIIHVIHLETLSELCGILKNEVLEDHVQNNGKYTDVITLRTLNCTCGLVNVRKNRAFPPQPQFISLSSYI